MSLKEVHLSMKGISFLVSSEVREDVLHFFVRNRGRNNSWSGIGALPMSSEKGGNTASYLLPYVTTC